MAYPKSPQQSIPICLNGKRTCVLRILRPALYPKLPPTGQMKTVVDAHGNGRGTRTSERLMAFSCRGVARISRQIRSMIVATCQKQRRARMSERGTSPELRSEAGVLPVGAGSPLPWRRCAAQHTARYATSSGAEPPARPPVSDRRATMSIKKSTR